MAVESKRLGCVIVSVDGSEESMNALRWALDNLKLRSPSPDSYGGHLVIFHVQSPPSIAAGLNPGAIPFGGPSDLEVPAFTAAIEAHQRKISDAIMKHALQICSDKNSSDMAVESKRLGCVIVSVDGSEESMNALRWALDNLKLRSPSPDSSGGHLVIFHIHQSPPSIAAGLNPSAIPFGGPSDLEVPAFTAAIEAHQRKISDAIMKHALQICSDKNVKNAKTHIVVGDPKEKVCEAVEEFHADLLVMGSRSFGPIKRDVSGKCKQLLLKPCTMPGNDSEGYFLTNCSCS
ncbi:unnamed protein product [Camellia sinensis]